MDVFPKLEVMKVLLSFLPTTQKKKKKGAASSKNTHWLNKLRPFPVYLFPASPKGLRGGSSIFGLWNMQKVRDGR